MMKISFIFLVILSRVSLNINFRKLVLLIKVNPIFAGKTIRRHIDDYFTQQKLKPVSICPTHTDAYFSKAATYQNMNKLEDALECFLLALAFKSRMLNKINQTMQIKKDIELLREKIVSEKKLSSTSRFTFSF